MAPHWVSLSFQPPPGVCGCRGLQGGRFVRFSASSTIVVPAGWPYDCAYLISHISNFSSKFCNIDCLTSHPPQAVVYRSRQTRVDVHVLTVIIQEYCFNIMTFQEPEHKLLPKKSCCPKHVTAQRHEFLPAFQASLNSRQTMGSCTG